MTTAQIWWGLGLSVGGTVLVLLFEAMIGKPVRGGVRAIRRRYAESQLATLEMVRSKDIALVHTLMLRTIGQMLVGLAFLGYAILLLTARPTLGPTLSLLTVLNLALFFIAGMISGHGIGIIQNAATDASLYWDALSAPDDRRRKLEARIARLSK